MQGGGRGRWGTVSHTPRNARKETQYGNLTNDQLYICCFFFMIFFFFHFVVSTMKLHALAGRSKKITSSGKRWSRMCKLKKLPPKLHASISVYFSTYLSSRCLVPPDPQPPPPLITPPAAQCCPGPRPQPQPHACVSPRSAASFAQPWASFHFWLANHGDTIWWCDIYALSGWSLFTCQSIRAPCCGKSNSHEASAREWTHDRQS